MSNSVSSTLNLVMQYINEKFSKLRRKTVNFFLKSHRASVISTYTRIILEM